MFESLPHGFEGHAAVQVYVYENAIFLIVDQFQRAGLAVHRLSRSIHQVAFLREIDGLVLGDMSQQML